MYANVNGVVLYPHISDYVNILNKYLNKSMVIMYETDIEYKNTAGGFVTIKYNF